MKNNSEKHTKIIKEKAKSFGFLDCGISKVDFLEEEAASLDCFLKSGYQGEMKYLENHFDKRLDPRLLVEGSKSIISLSYNYFPQQLISQENNYKIAKFAYGEDYHFVIKDKLKPMVLELQKEIGHFECRIFVDSAPILEKSWAKKSGLGWIGKNGNIISKQKGSYFFLAEIICDLELETDSPVMDYCGNCTKCIDACPTKAIVNDRIVDGSKCISYATIELKNAIPDFFKDKMQDWIFGCDICQEVCPWNRFAVPTQEEKFAQNTQLKHFHKEDWEEISEEIFSELFQQSAIQRTKYAGLKRNIEFVNTISN